MLDLVNGWFVRVENRIRRIKYRVECIATRGKKLEIRRETIRQKNLKISSVDNDGIGKPLPELLLLDHTLLGSNHLP